MTSKIRIGIACYGNLGRGMQAAADYDLAATLGGLPQPVLLLNPEDDVRVQTSRAVLKNGQVHDLPGWTHGFIDSKAAETAKIVRDFLDR